MDKQDEIEETKLQLVKQNRIMLEGDVNKQMLKTNEEVIKTFNKLVLQSWQATPRKF